MKKHIIKPATAKEILTSLDLSKEEIKKDLETLNKNMKCRWCEMDLPLSDDGLWHWLDGAGDVECEK